MRWRATAALLALGLLSACGDASPGTLQLDLRFADDALSVPPGLELSWRILVRWEEADARSEGPYIPGEALEVGAVPQGPGRQVLVEIFEPQASGERVWYYGRSARFDLKGGTPPVAVVLSSAPRASAAGLIVVPSTEPDFDGATRSPLVNLEIEALAGSRIRVGLDAAALEDDDNERTLGSLERAGARHVWRAYRLDVPPCSDDAPCPRSHRVFAQLRDENGYAGAQLQVEVVYDDLGFRCAGAGPGACEPICGDSLVVGWEVCDDGNRQDGDSCSPDCLVVTGECGDGALQLDEECDDGGTAGGDGCDADCRVEPGWRCTPELGCGRVVHVDASASGAADGRSWADAFVDLQSALLSATAGAEVRVAAGRYTPDVGPGVTQRDRDATFQIPEGVAVYGGFNGSEMRLSERDPVVNETILDGDLDGDGTDPNNSLHVVTIGDVGTDTVLDGFTVRGGYADGESSNSGTGGGIFVNRGQPTLRNLRLEENFAREGGGIYLWRATSEMQQVSFVENEAQQGGGLYVFRGSARIFDARFERNGAVDLQGGDLDPPTALSVSGGAIFVDEGLLWAERVHVMDNESEGGAAGVTVKATSLGEVAEAALVNALFWRNRARIGGALYNEGGETLVIGATFTKNCGGFFRDDTVGGPPVAECEDDGAPNGGAVYTAAGTTSVVNSILWGNTPQELLAGPESTTIVRYSIVRDGMAGEGNSDADPLLGSDPGAPRPQADSPAIDAGDNGAVPRSVSTDLDGLPRFAGPLDPPRVDMGAYEAQ